MSLNTPFTEYKNIVSRNLRIEYYETNLRKSKEDLMLNVIASPSEKYLSSHKSNSISKEERKLDLDFMKVLRQSIQLENKNFSMDEGDGETRSIPEMLTKVP